MKFPLSFEWNIFYVLALIVFEVLYVFIMYQYTKGDISEETLGPSEISDYDLCSGCARVAYWYCILLDVFFVVDALYQEGASRFVMLTVIHYVALIGIVLHIILLVSFYRIYKLYKKDTKDIEFAKSRYKDEPWLKEIIDDLNSTIILMRCLKTTCICMFILFFISWMRYGRWI